MKIGVITPTRGTEREYFKAQRLALLKAQTLQPAAVYDINYSPKDSAPDLYPRLCLGVQQSIKDGMDRVFVMEDDDYYAPNYLATQMRAWQPGVQLYGMSGILYYHLIYRKWVVMPNNTTAALCITGFVPTLFNQLELNPKDLAFEVDTHIWDRTAKAGILRQLMPYDLTCIGMKHNVGVCGGGWHTDSRNWYCSDPAHHWLEKFVDPQFITFYKQFKYKYLSPEIVFAS